MAKRPTTRTQSQADDAATAAPPRPRARRSRAGESGETSPADAAIASTDPDLSSAADADMTSDGWQPTEEDIRVRAYHRYLERGGSHGLDFDDWLEAERELKHERNG